MGIEYMIKVAFQSVGKEHSANGNHWIVFWEKKLS